ncbi:MAG: hypothetical protein H6810_00585 [Phycisphaeraceae bacterium]|nr:MAG: hypothetical protein H6810_00585 [Phycisphaeraceae bacterium]
MAADHATTGSRHTTDHHGRRVSLLDPYPLMIFRRFDRIDEPTLEAILADLGAEYTHIKRNMWIGFASLAAVVVISAAAIGISVIREGPDAWRDLVGTITSPTMLPVFAASIGGGVIAPWFAIRAKRFALLRGAMLGHYRCPHCGYGIRSVPANDGAVTCPECAAAWPEAEVGAPTARPMSDSAHQRQVILLLLVGFGLMAMLGATVMFWVL